MMGLARKIDHIAIAVKDLDTAVDTFIENFGFPVSRKGALPALQIERAFLEIGDASLELFQPMSEQNPASKFITERGEGMYLLSLEVDDMQKAVATMAAKGIKVSVQSLPDGMQLGFISPKNTHGVLLQLIQHPK
jgi:methylmalonyl-CoA epimerase